MERMVGVVHVDGAAPTIAWESGPPGPDPEPRPAVLRLNRGAGAKPAIPPEVVAEQQAEPLGAVDPPTTKPAKRKYTRRSQAGTP